MSWRESLQPASFRGVAFHVEEAPRRIGRRLGMHEYVGRDVPFAEDLGRRGRVVPVRGFVIGTDHIAQAKKLAEALEAPGPGTLVHPWLGEMTLAVDDVTETWSVREGGVCTFDVRFVETADVRYPAAVADRAEATDLAAVAAKQSVLDDFLADFGLEDLPGWLGDDAVALLTDAGDAIGDALGPAAGWLQEAQTGLSPIVSGVETAARWARAGLRLVSEAPTLIHNPLLLAGRVMGLLDLGSLGGGASLLQVPLDLWSTATSIFGDGSRGIADRDDLPSIGTAPAWQAYLPLVDWQPDVSDIPLTTASRRQQAANREALGALVRRAALIEADRAAVRTSFETASDAVAARDVLLDRHDREEEAAPDASWQALVDLRNKMVQAIAAETPELPRLITVTPAQTRPAVAIAYDTFGDDPSLAADRADQLVSRNAVRHPLFVRGGQAVQMVGLS